MRFYYLKCCEKEARDLTLFDDAITILPRQMSKLPVPKIRTQAESFAYDENPLYSDQNLYEPCEIPEDERKPMKMNILIIQIDSVSNNHFKRMFPDTLEFLSRSLPNNVIFENFMVVGENTVPNSFPWIGGVIPNGIKELKISKEQSIYSYDFSNRFPLIWKDFQKLGHITSYNEDYLINGNFKDVLFFDHYFQINIHYPQFSLFYKLNKLLKHLDRPIYMIKKIYQWL